MKIYKLTSTERQRDILVAVLKLALDEKDKIKIKDLSLHELFKLKQSIEMVPATEVEEVKIPEVKVVKVTALLGDKVTTYEEDMAQERERMRKINESNKARYRRGS